MNRALLTLSAALALTACASNPANQASAVDSSAIRAAVQNSERLAEDRARDAGRKPEQVLNFFGIAPGMTVLDLYSGGGYYSELLSHVVGTGGSVHAHNNQAYLNYVAKTLEARYTPGRLANVQQMRAENNQLDLSANTYDAVLMILTYHDVYYVDEANGWPKLDGPKLLAEIYQGMKRGAVLGVVEHVASAQTPLTEAAQVLHRLDPERLRRDLEAAGFVLDASSDMLRNPQDNLSVGVFDQSIAGNTDRVVYRYLKP